MIRSQQRPRSIVVNRAERIEAVRRSKIIPEAVKEFRIAAIRMGDQHAGVAGASFELSWRRGYHSGYVDGYKDAKKRKAPKWD